MIQLESITKRFGPIIALDNVSLAVEPGEIVALWGPSGCGKSTVLRAVAGLERPDSGSIRLRNAPVTGSGAWVEPHLRDTGFVFQELALWPHLRAETHVHFALRGRGLGRAERAEECAQLFDACRLTGKERAYPGELSGGERQRVAWARALAGGPDILLLDESFAYLDGALVAHFIELAQDRAKCGTAILLASHQRDLVDNLASRVVTMREGQIENSG